MNKLNVFIVGNGIEFEKELKRLSRETELDIHITELNEANPLPVELSKLRKCDLLLVTENYVDYDDKTVILVHEAAMHIGIPVLYCDYANSVSNNLFKLDEWTRYLITTICLDKNLYETIKEMYI